jgi:hypothetical protein
LTENGKVNGGPRDESEMVAKPDGTHPTILLSYRHDDPFSSGYARLLYYALTARFGENVVMDIDLLAPGVNSVDVIGELLDTCDIMLALIGPSWLTATDDSGRRRLEDEGDYVRLEIEAALSRNVLIVSILIGAAKMPEVREIPESLAPLVRRPPLRLSERRWRVEFDEVLVQLERWAIRRQRPE